MELLIPDLIEYTDLISLKINRRRETEFHRRYRAGTDGIAEAKWLGVIIDSVEKRSMINFRRWESI
jgi:hypothetical protein